MKELAKYNIDIFGLEDKRYVYDFESGDAFFEELQQDVIQHGSFRAQVTLDKSSTMVQLLFDITGSVVLTCDRTLDPFDEPIDTEGRMILKFGDHDEELTEEIEIIHRNTNRINVARYIFDFIVLSLPMKRLHPSIRNEETGEEDDEFETLVYSSHSDNEPDEEEATPNDDTEGEVDPRWEALKKLRGK
ncbi:DUF177 domain-containing protein [Telluribacter sp. SYSU D00476]|uniref:YceD family protein n=1 Tax=Telluribacter sp. SYSU D00476 TaxID=2811430 RepID=UPI001FF57F2F|nr:DUF177 domain-containing protein [Telluribacter sp. SYSU D00476]